ncbi:MAG: hypothetical protein BWX47_01894 [candidate division Hyd24-12 bacterium ADurb.Bin004]|nr:MAG: hypothetical protein BWX47_01894 [candidate division Hyd24-12 bacterium ADurb.Bin004]
MNRLCTSEPKRSIARASRGRGRSVRSVRRTFITIITERLAIARISESNAASVAMPQAILTA